MTAGPGEPRSNEEPLTDALYAAVYDVLADLDDPKPRTQKIVALVRVEREDHDRRIAQALHEVWLAVHVRRFDRDKVDSFYSGVIHSEHQIAEVAARYGVDWHALRDPSRAALAAASPGDPQ